MSNNTYFWYLQPKDSVHNGVQQATEDIFNQQSYNTTEIYRNLQLFHSSYSSWQNLENYDGFSLGTSDRMSMNVLQVAGDILLSILATNRPRAYFLTTNGSYNKQMAAKKLTKFTDGCFHVTDLYHKDKWAFLDAYIAGSSFYQVQAQEGEILLDRVMPGEVQVIDTETLYGSPSQYFRKTAMPRDKVMSLYPEQKEYIKSATLVGDQLTSDNVGYKYSDMITVYEATKMPSKKNAKDGRFVRCCSACSLEDYEYKYDYPPYAKYDFRERPAGFRGIPGIDLIKNLQTEIDYIAQKIQRHMNGPASFIGLDSMAKVPKNAITNEEHMVMYFANRPPVFKTIQAISPEYMQYMEYLYQKCLAMVGINETAAQSKTPNRFDSKPALQLWNETTSARHLHLKQRWEDFHIDVAKRMIDCAREIDAEGANSYSVQYFDKHSAEKVEWKNIDLAEDEYVIRPYPTSFLATTPSGRLEQLMGLIQVFPEYKALATKYLDFPDIEDANSVVNAPRDFVDYCINLVLEKGKYVSPEPFMDIPYALIKIKGAIAKGSTNDLDEEKLAMLHQWAVALKDMINPEPEMPLGAPAPVAPVPEGGPPGQIAPSGAQPQMGVPQPLPSQDMPGQGL